MPANTIDLDFGSLDFNSTNDLTVADIQVKERKSVKVYEIPKSDGAIAETAKRRELIITVSGDIAGTDYDDLRSNLDTLRAGLQDGEQKFTLDDDRYIKGQLRTFDYSWLHLKRIAIWKATFICHYPVWLSETESTDDRTPSSGVGYTVNNPGNAPVRVKVEITAPAGGISDDIQLENTTTGELFRYRGDLAAGDVLEVDNRYDTDDFEVLNDGTDDHTNFEGDFLTLDPGNNTIEFTGTASTDVKITYRAGYY